MSERIVGVGVLIEDDAAWYCISEAFGDSNMAFRAIPSALLAGERGIKGVHIRSLGSAISSIQQ